jgi:hypothetical protein
MFDGEMFSDIEVSRNNGIKSIKTVAVFVQHAMRMRRILLTVACPALPYFPDSNVLSGTFFRKKQLLDITCMF